MDITLTEARSCALHYNLYRFQDYTGKAGALAALRQLSYIQIDTINVIERAHHHTLYNRVLSYQPDMLMDLLAVDKVVWEYWGHAASYLPIEDYPYYKQRMLDFPNGSWEQKYWQEHQQLAEPILERIRTEGALSASNFEDTRLTRITPGWGDWKPAKFMLELLMWKGDLIVTGRRNFQRVYDLTERVIPHHRDVQPPSESERLRFMILRALQSHGIASEFDFKNHLFIAPKKTLSDRLKLMLSSGEIIPVNIAGIQTPYYTLAETASEMLNQTPSPQRVFLLSPFDNSVILRPRLKQLFDFEYTIECYVPAAKRLYGYWTMPVLWKNAFIGRIDPKAIRKTRTLWLNSVHIATKVWKSREFQSAFEQELTAFAQFNGCDTYTIDRVFLS